MSNAETMTAQELFQKCKPYYDAMNKKQQEEGLSASEAAAFDVMKERLFKSVVKYGLALARQTLVKYRKDNDAYQDVAQDLAAIFFEKLPDYDPYWTTPVTYFDRYFKQVISEYVHQYSQHLSQYDARNLGMLRGAIRDYESRGIKWDEMMLSTKTGLSSKVVHQTLLLGNNSIYANVEDAYDMATKLPGPEEELIRSDKENVLAKALMELSEEDREFFLYKVDLDAKDERTYTQLAKHFGMEVKDAKRRYNQIRVRLANDPNLSGLSRNYQRKPSESLKFERKISDEALNDAIQTLSQLIMHLEEEK